MYITVIYDYMHKNPFVLLFKPSVEYEGFRDPTFSELMRRLHGTFSTIFVVIHLSINLCDFLSTCLSIDIFIYLCVYSSIHSSIYCICVYVFDHRRTPEHFDFKEGLRHSSNTKLSLAALNQASRQNQNQVKSYGSSGGGSVMHYQQPISSEERYFYHALITFYTCMYYLYISAF